MICPECGAQTVPNANFCGNCRHSLVTNTSSMNSTPYRTIEDPSLNTIPSNRPYPSLPKRKQRLLLLGLLVILVMGGGIFALTRLFPASPPSVVITSPTHGSPVPIKTTIHGTASGIPSSDELWVLIVPDGLTAYYPQEPGPVQVGSDGKWTASATVGITKDTGRGFTIYAALANQDGSTAIHAYVSGANSNGLDPLPQGIQLVNQVHVVRT